MNMPRSLSFHLPDWMFTELDLDRPRRSDEERMELAIDIARRNVEHGGGPFGAVVFESASGQVVSVGANLVVGQHSSLLHAEVVAIMFAQAALESYTLDVGQYELVSSSDPCVQCLGAVHWSGLRRLVCGAPVEAAQAAGFDEGPRADDWKEQLATRGVAVRESLLAEQASAVLQQYVSRGGLLYNSRQAT
jgi:tRNA(Arg) A34 adenosine deaminase TadA